MRGNGLEKDEEKAAHCYRLCGEMTQKNRMKILFLPRSE